MGNIIQVRNLRKAFRRQRAVEDVSFVVGRGRILALLGPNGAGKSTTISILCTSMKPDSGFVSVDGRILGHSDRDIRRRIGVVFQGGVLDDLLTVEENLSIRGRLYGLAGGELARRVMNTAGMTGILPLLGRQYGRLSGGQRRRCDIARALIHLPKVLLLDEPTAGLDPEMRTAVWQTIRGIRQKRNMTVLLTTHYMEEAVLADDVVILKEGRVVAEGTPPELKKKFSVDLLVFYSQAPDDLVRALRSRGVIFVRREMSVDIPLATTKDALPLFELCRGMYSDFEVKRGSMEDAYLAAIAAEGSP